MIVLIDGIRAPVEKPSKKRKIPNCNGDWANPIGIKQINDTNKPINSTRWLPKRSPSLPKAGEATTAETPEAETIKPLIKTRLVVLWLNSRMYKVKIGLILVIPTCKINEVTNKPSKISTLFVR